MFRKLLIAFLLAGALSGCGTQRVSKIGQMSERPMVRITVGTSIEIRLPAIEFDGDDGGGEPTD